MTVKEEHPYAEYPAHAYADLRKGVAILGAVKQADDQALTIEGRIKHGLNARTRIEAEVRPAAWGSVITFVSRGGDAGGRAARDNVTHLMEAMRHADDADYDASPPSQSQWRRVGYMAVGGVLVLFAVLGISTGWTGLLWLALILAPFYVWGMAKLK